MTTTQSSTPRQVTFNTEMKKDKRSFDLMVKVITHLSENVENQTFDTLWDLVSSKPLKFYTKHFRHEAKKNNPLSDVKRPRTAYTYFTKDRRNAIRDENPDRSFGDISKLLSVEWRALSARKLSTYTKLEQADKSRYAKEKVEVEAHLATTPVEEVVEEVVVEPVATKKASKRSSSPPAKKVKTSVDTKKGKRGKKHGKSTTK
jgi:hypothetical protein